jgi:Leucine-rich repeat (LRR) protein
MVSLHNLQLLIISGNNIHQLPANINKLQNLKPLIALNNPFSAAEKQRVRNALPGCQVYFDKD